MNISDYKNLIDNMPVEGHAFTIKKKNWERFFKLTEIKEVFDKDEIIISRKDLFKLAKDQKKTTEFIVKVLMWGYPTGGRGNNIKNLLEEKSYKALVDFIDDNEIRNSNNQVENIKNKIKELKKNGGKGLGISTISKLLYFLKVKIAGKLSVILDQRIIDVLNKAEFKDFEELKDIKMTSSISKYIDNYYQFLEKIASVNKDLAIKDVGKIEMFLFIFGGNLKDKSP
tara:strand:+ start:1045 stop:1725 length:681 start_codon:yes stop_codon:yes gene_type:complete